MHTLEIVGLCASYGPVRVLHGLDLAIPHGEIVALLGANGAGKSTVLQAVSGMIPATGTIRLNGQRLDRLDAASRVRRGLAHIPQGRGTFRHFTVEENLVLGAIPVNDKRQVREDIDKWFARFPGLAHRRRQAAGNLSGGEQQMLAVARALMSRPKLLVCDEPSLGLAPVIVRDLFQLLADLNRERGLSVLLVEQNADLSLKIAHRAYVLELGKVTLQGTAEELAGSSAVQRAYLGA